MTLGILAVSTVPAYAISAVPEIDAFSGLAAMGANSIANPYGRYGSQYSPDSINNPYGAGSRYAPDSPYNPYGQGMRVYRGQ